MSDAMAVPAWVGRVRPELRDARVLGVRAGTAHVVAGLTDDGPVVLKRYRRDEAFAAVARLRRVVRGLDAAPSPRLGVPGVVAFDARTGVLTQSLAPGRPLLPLLRSPRCRPALRAAADALAALHASPVRLGRTTTVADHLAELIHPHPRVVGRDVPAVAARIHALVRAFDDHARRRPAVIAPIHRDAHARQMLLDRSRVWLLDWDLAAMGDPALDVANFRVYLRTHLTHGDDAATEFLAGYARHDAAVEARLPAYEALTYLRLACKAWRLRAAGWRRRLDAHLAAAERRL